MDLPFRHALRAAILRDEGYDRVIKSISMSADGRGAVEYNASGVRIAPNTPGFDGYRTAVSDEELVRAYLLTQLTTKLGYPADAAVLEMKRAYKPVGRPTGKGGRVDITVRKRDGDSSAPVFLFVECKAPSKFDSDLRYLEGQLFRLSLQEVPRPRYLLYFTVEFKAGELRERRIIVDTRTFSSYEDWNAAGQPITDAVPIGYGLATKKRFGNVDHEDEKSRPLDRATTPETFSRLRTELHDVIWGGGGTNNNEVFVYITRLILAKIFDEKETPPGNEYEFQRHGDATAPESASKLTARINELYQRAERAYLAPDTPIAGPAFDTARISAEKIAFVVGRLEGISITENVHPGDLLGDFFERIVAQDFTQTKGQFFTPSRIVNFMLDLCDAGPTATLTMHEDRDHLGRPRLPYVIDPSCGAGTFLIEYMRRIRRQLGTDEVRRSLAPRLREAHETWFAGGGNAWAREYLFAIENNHDLGLAAKVNMVLHGDGSMNTWIASGLAPFSTYWTDGRTNILGTSKNAREGEYAAAVNEQFDLVISNPPFSIKLSPDERRSVKTGFDELPTKISEALFIERWYQLLRDGGRFCCVIPEAILDTGSSEPIRRFLIERFEILAVVSLPYDAFRPFTSTKTAIVYAEKRAASEIAEWASTLRSVRRELPGSDEHEQFREALRRIGWAEQQIFMAEPRSIGYKRRKNLADVTQPDDLVGSPATGRDVLSRWNAPDRFEADARYGFQTTLASVTARSGFRLDPKYRWLWDLQRGHVLGAPDRARPLGDVLRLVRLAKVPRGELTAERRLIDLEAVESRQAFVADTPLVDELGSDKISFAGAEIAISKLEPYLGKVLMSPPEDAVGSTEWIGLRRVAEHPLLVVAYLLMLPEMCEAYRRLQAGKRHARLAPSELLDLLVEFPDAEQCLQLERRLSERRDGITQLRLDEIQIRAQIDDDFATLRQAPDLSPHPPEPQAEP